MLMKIEKGGNEKLSLKVVVYVLFVFYTCQMTSQMMTAFQELFTNKPMRAKCYVKMLYLSVIFASL